MFKKDKPKQVKCETCKHWIDIEDAQKVKSDDRSRYYCPMHQKPYDVEDNSYFADDIHFYKVIPEHMERVNKDGSTFAKE